MKKNFTKILKIFNLTSAKAIPEKIYNIGGKATAIVAKKLVVPVNKL